MDEADARRIVADLIAGAADDPHYPMKLVVSAVERFARGWIVYYCAEDPQIRLAGNAPYLVDEATGGVYGTGTAYAVEHYVENYLRTGSPHRYRVGSRGSPSGDGGMVCIAQFEPPGVQARMQAWREGNLDRYGPADEWVVDVGRSDGGEVVRVWVTFKNYGYEWLLPPETPGRGVEP